METVQMETRLTRVSARQVSLEITARMRMIVTTTTPASIILPVLTDPEIILAHAQKGLPEVTVKVNCNVALYIGQFLKIFQFGNSIYYFRK